MILNNLNNSVPLRNSPSNPKRRVDNQHINVGGGNLNTQSQIITRKDNNNLKKIFQVYKNGSDRKNNNTLMGTREGGNFFDDVIDTIGKGVSAVAPVLPFIL